MTGILIFKPRATAVPFSRILAARTNTRFAPNLSLHPGHANNDGWTCPPYNERNYVTQVLQSWETSFGAPHQELDLGVEFFARFFAAHPVLVRYFNGADMDSLARQYEEVVGLVATSLGDMWHVRETEGARPLLYGYGVGSMFLMHAIDVRLYLSLAMNQPYYTLLWIPMDCFVLPKTSTRCQKRIEQVMPALRHLGSVLAGLGINAEAYDAMTNVSDVLNAEPKEISVVLVEGCRCGRLVKALFTECW